MTLDSDSSRSALVRASPMILSASFLARLDELVGVAGRDLEQSGRGVRGLGDGLDPDRLGGGGATRLGAGSGVGSGAGSGSGARSWTAGVWARGRGVLEARAAAGLGRGQLGAQVVVLLGQPRQLGLDLVEELVDLTHVVALAEPDRREALVTHVLRRQRHVPTHSSSSRFFDVCWLRDCSGR